MFLTEEELKDLTGYQRPKAIMRWLKEHGYRFEVSAYGWPKVLRDAVCARLGIQTPNSPRLNLG